MALAVPVMLALKLENCGCQVDFKAVWDTPHTGDYDLEDFFRWIYSITRDGDNN